MAPATRHTIWNVANGISKESFESHSRRFAKAEFSFGVLAGMFPSACLQLSPRGRRSPCDPGQEIGQEERSFWRVDGKQIDTQASGLRSRVITGRARLLLGTADANRRTGFDPDKGAMRYSVIFAAASEIVARLGIAFAQTTNRAQSRMR